jgi:hypothetical protein
VLAALSGVTLGVSMLFSYGVWKLRDEKEIKHESLDEMAAAARNPNADLFDMLVQHYGFILWSRRENNKARARNFNVSIPLWIAAVLLALVELVVALAVVVES